MGRIRLEIQPWVSDVFSNHEAGNIILEETVDEGTTIGDLMRKLSSENQAFSDVIFDTENDKLSGQVMIVLNNRIVEAMKGMDTKINDGDIIALLPVIAGG
ncbi:MoaD/ThiS family protein [Chloroflexota bacterium]